MSESDSFLQEVSEEVRRDQLVKMLRKNAVWIALVIVVAIGGVSYFEWSKSRAAATAQANGAGLWEAIQLDDDAGRLAVLEALDVSPQTEPLRALQTASARAGAGATDEAVSILQTLAADPDVSAPLKDVARLQLAAISGGHLEDEARLDLLERMTIEGHALRPLALEQRAMIHLAKGDVSAAQGDLSMLTDDPLAPQSARFRADQVLQALGPIPGGDG